MSSKRKSGLSSNLRKVHLDIDLVNTDQVEQSHLSLCQLVTGFLRISVTVFRVFTIILTLTVLTMENKKARVRNIKLL